MALRLVCGLALVCGLVCVLSAGAVHAAGPSLSSAPISGVVPPRGAVHNTSPIGPDNLSYNGGPVMRSNTTYAIYWLPAGYSYGSSASNYESTLNQFFTDVAHDSGGHANVYSTDPQYYDTVGGGYHYADYSSTFAGSVVDTNAFPASGCTDPSSLALPVCLTQSQELNEVYNVITARGWPIGDDSVEYFLFTPQNVTSCSGSDCAYTQFCAYHTYFTVGGAPVVWANQPWTSGINSCDTGTHPNSSDADPTINVVSHEHNEAITDPLLNAWYDSGGNENGDKCAWTFGTLNGSSNQTINGHGYLLQEEWDNSGSQCLQGFTPPTPTVSSLSPTGGAVGTAVTINGTGFVSPSAVKFNGTNASSFTIVSTTQLTATPAVGTTSGPVSVVTPGGTATSSGDFTVAPTVTSFTPTSGGPGTSVTIDGTSFSGATAVTFNGTPAASFTVDSDTQITAVVAAGTTTGAVAVTNAGGTATSSSDFTVVTPVVMSFAPTSGGTGTSVTVTGSGFTGVTGVTFGGVDAADFSLVSDSELTATVPIGAVTGPIAVTTLGGTGASADDFTVVPAPTVTSFTPTSGAVGTTVTITGTDLTGATGVTFGGTPAASFAVDSDTQVSAVVADGTTNGTVAVTTSGGTATSSGSYTVTPSPAPDSFTPTSGWTGTHVTIQGAYLQTATGVSFNGTPAASFNVESSSVLNAYVAAGTTSGPITVSFPSGTVTVPGTFAMVPPPTLTDVSPASGTVGTTLTLTGTNLATATRVDFTGSFSTMTSFTVDSDTQITVAVPSGATTGTLSVTTPSGVATAPSPFTVITQPSVTSLTPSSGGPGTSVSISGTGLTGATAVKFNGTDAASFTVSSDTRIVATAPATMTSGTISVTNAAGTGTSSGTFTFVPAPTISDFSPTSGGTSTRITIDGTNLSGVTTATIGGVAVTGIVHTSSTQIAVYPAAQTVSGPIAVTGPGGTATSTGAFTFYATPGITGFTPASGGAGTTVVITGSAFTGATEVKFGNTSASSFTVDSPTQITAVVASGATGTVSITAPGGTGASSSVFTFFSAPTVSGFSPTAGPPGTSVTITGTNLTGATAVSFNGTAASYSVVSATEITATVPSGASSGTIAATTPGGTAESADSFTVTSLAPDITGFSPGAGGAGTKVEVDGDNFTGATAVKFGGTDASTFNVVDAHTIYAWVGGGASGPISVDTPNGTATSSTDFTFYPPAEIASFSPSGGPVGTTVTLTGSGFTGASAVNFNGTPATDFTVDSDTQVTAVVPAGATSGIISIVARGGTGTSGQTFRVGSVTISGINPGGCQHGCSATITGTGFTGATEVDFNGTASTSYAVDSDTQITAVVPYGSTTGPVSVTTPLGTGTSSFDFEVFLAVPQISSFPSWAVAGDSINIGGSHFSDATSVSFNGVDAASYTVNSDSQITATIPGAATTGQITVTTPDGSATSTASLTIYHAPTVTLFTPTAGRSGGQVTITGTSFTGATGVMVGDMSADFTVDSETQITATVPDGATSGTISVTGPGGTGTSSDSFTVYTSPAPVISSFTPAKGKVGTKVVIRGADLAGATSVSFDGVSAVPLLATGTTLTVLVPAGATSGKLDVTTPTGGTGESTATFWLDPIVSSFSPGGGPDGTHVTILGSGFDGATAVKFNTTNADSFTVVNDGKITATVAPGTTTGYVAVTTPAGSARSLTKYAADEIHGISPAKGKPGTKVTITGVGFTGATAVKFHGTPAASFVVAGDTRIVAVVADGTTSGPVTVTSPAGTMTSAASFGVPAAIDSFSPGVAPAGTTITILGSGFVGATAVKVNTTAATDVVVVNDGKITATIADKTTSGFVSVTTPGGTARSSTRLTVVGIAHFSPTHGAAGTTVTIIGSGLTGATGVRFNGTPAASFKAVSDTKVTAVVGDGTTSGPIAVATPHGTVTSATSFGIVPHIDSFDPSEAAAGATVTIHGSGFTGATAVKIGGTLADNLDVVDDGKITAKVDAKTKSGVVEVITPYGTATSKTRLQVVGISGFSPSRASAGSTVTISGSGLTGATAVRFNGTDAASFDVSSDTKITAVVADGTTSGTIAVVTPNGTVTSAAGFGIVAKLDSFDPAEGAVGATVTITGSGFTGASAVKIDGKTADALDVVNDGEITAKIASGTTSGYVAVTTPGGTVTSKTKLTVVSVSSFTPARAAVGHTVTVYGSGLTGATSVTFDGIDAASFDVVSDARITAVVPAGAKSGTIGVVTTHGTLSSSTSFGVVAVVQSFSPASAAPGTTVTISGSGFTDATAVTIGGVSAGSLSIVDDSHITVTVPAGAKTGRIAVRTGGGTTSSSQTFHLVALSPSGGGDGGTNGNPFRLSIWRILLGGR